MPAIVSMMIGAGAFGFGLIRAYRANNRFWILANAIPLGFVTAFMTIVFIELTAR